VDVNMDMSIDGDIDGNEKLDVYVCVLVRLM